MMIIVLLILLAMMTLNAAIFYRQARHWAKEYLTAIARTKAAHDAHKDTLETLEGTLALLATSQESHQQAMEMLAQVRHLLPSTVPNRTHQVH